MSGTLSIITDVALGSMEFAITSHGAQADEYNTAKRLPKTHVFEGQDEEDRMLPTGPSVSNLLNARGTVVSKLCAEVVGIFESSPTRKYMRGHLILEKIKDPDALRFARLRPRYNQDELSVLISLAKDSYESAQRIEKVQFAKWIAKGRSPNDVEVALKALLTFEDRWFVFDIVSSYSDYLVSIKSAVGKDDKRLRSRRGAWWTTGYS